MSYDQRKRIICPDCNVNNMSNRQTCWKCGRSLSGLPAQDPLPINYVPKPQRTVQQSNTTISQPKSGNPGTIIRQKKQVVLESALGFGLGCSYSVWMLLIGIVLCFTGIGIIIGVPLIIAGIIMPLAPFVLSYFSYANNFILQGKCPHCQLLIDIGSDAVKQTWVDCPGCKCRMLILNNTLYKPEDVSRWSISWCNWLFTKAREGLIGYLFQRINIFYIDSYVFAIWLWQSVYWSGP